MAIRATISSIPKTRVSINSGGVISAGVSQFRNLSDVNATNLTTDNIVVYDGDTDKFVVKELPKINGGTF